MNNSSSSSLTAVPYTSETTWPKVTLGLYILTLILGLFGNLLVLATILSKKASLRRPHKLFILNLALSDLLVIIFFLPFQIYIFLGPFNPSLFYCKFVASLITIGLGAGIFTLTVMAVHRCKVMTDPFKPGISQKSIILCLTMVWILSFSLAVPKMVTSNTKFGRCIQLWPTITHRKVNLISSFISRFAIPLFVIAYAYFRIAKDLARSTALRFALDENGQVKNFTARRENIEVVRMLAVIVLLFVICMLPSRLATIVMLFGDQEQATLARNVRKYTSVLTVAHSCLNPIAYGTLNKRFRVSIARWASGFNPWKIRHAIREKHVKVRESSTNDLDTASSGPRKKSELECDLQKYLLQSRRMISDCGRKETVV